LEQATPSRANARRILVRATNWIGDAVMSLPALAAIRARFPGAHITVLARSWVAGLYAREPFADEIIVDTSAPPRRGALLQAWRDRTRLAAELRERQFDCALLLPNAFDAALVAALARIPERIGYARDGRSPLLTRAIDGPRTGEIPVYEPYYYLELLRRAGWLDALPAQLTVELRCADGARQAGLTRFAERGVTGAIVGVSPGAAFGSAKRWLPVRFAAAAVSVANALNATVALHGSPAERELCAGIAAAIERQGLTVLNFAGATTLEEFIELAAASTVFLTNDSGAMHVASALNVPTVAVFGATNDLTTGPGGRWSRVVREAVECAPCQLRECPIDHRCMTRVTDEAVSKLALDLVQLAGK
jgi:heptosyltransferase-2